MNNLKNTITSVLIAFLLGSCATVQDSGRKQLLLISPADESQLGAQEFQKMKTRLPISKNPRINALVQKVGKRIAAVVQLPDAQWEFVVFDQPDTMNAFCLPGGKVGIFTGILPVTQTEEGLATVMGHEVAHAVARHGAERMSQGIILQKGGQVLDVLAQNKSEGTRQMINSAYGMSASVGVMLPFSRSHELEADELGQLYMARAGYDPAQAISFWERFASAAKGGKAPAEFMSTHPLDATRIKALQKSLPKAQAEYVKSSVK